MFRPLRFVQLTKSGRHRTIPREIMNIVYVLLAVMASMFPVACATEANKAEEGDRRGKVTASGYTPAGCLLNLKQTAHDKGVRLLPQEVEVERNSIIFLFPFLNHEGYRCSGTFTEKRPLGKDPFYPIE
jgi:hypothetical protein